MHRWQPCVRSGRTRLSLVCRGRRVMVPSKVMGSPSIFIGRDGNSGLMVEGGWFARDADAVRSNDGISSSLPVACPVRAHISHGHGDVWSWGFSSWVGKACWSGSGEGRQPLRGGSAVCWEAIGVVDASWRAMGVDTQGPRPPPPLCEESGALE